MSRRKKTRTDGGFYQVMRLMTRSAAYKSLSPRAGWLLHALMDLYDGNDNRVAMSWRTAQAWLKSGPTKAGAAFAELEAKGFIRCHERGGFTRKIRHATVWMLTMFGRSGQKATLDFLSWQPDQKSKHGYCGRSNTATEVEAMDTPIATKAEAVRPLHGYQGESNTATKAEALIDLPSRGGTKIRAPIGTASAKAAWLHSWLKSGRLSCDEVASVLEIAPRDVEPIAAGKIGLALSSWQKLAALVSERMN